MTDSPATGDEPRYRIGAVCRMTGISQHVLRVWEKRYGVVEPVRSETDRRLYRESDISRLSLLKALVDRGQAIGSIADLADDELERRVQQSAGILQIAAGAEKPALALFGGLLSLTRDDCASSEAFTLVGHYEDLSEFTAQKSQKRLDVAVIEWPSLQTDSTIEITRHANRLNARQVVLVYDYAPRAALQQLVNDRITALRSPLDIAALEAVVAWRFGLVAQPGESTEDAVGVSPSRQFNDRELTYLAAQSSAIACECPMHLAHLISRLVKFEAYSAECESRNAEDAALHGYLHNTTSRARSMME
ncbi:MAG: MerR family transcriptional regulator, partial [Woeseiaceae bacterium]|nr:MerR family transcriptional regulator [Woeseiaceae bacterium]